MNTELVRVRFAPSPTGQFHIGGVRTALYNFIYARATGGVFVLRIEDTDLERSNMESEKLHMEGMKWLGMDYDEGPDKPGEFGPYRQSERLEIYKKYADELITKGKAFYCFCTDEELLEKKEKAKAGGLNPNYDGTCRNLSHDEVSKRLQKGEKAAVRFKVPIKAFTFKDRVKGEVTFPENMVGDFIILRSNGLPVYNYCCVIDDYLMKITHVIRGDDHLANTLRQLMLYEAISVSPPEFAHVSLIVGHDRQKLSKRHGATSLNWYKDETYFPEAVVNYMSLLGWSHPEEKSIFDLEELKRVFTIDRFVKSPATFDNEKFKWVNGQHLRSISCERLLDQIGNILPQNHRYFEQDDEWRKNCVELFREKVDLSKDMWPMIDRLFDASVEQSDGMNEINSWETTPVIREYLKSEMLRLDAENREFPTISDVNSWMKHLKGELKIKGKPLFMGMRAVLTGQDHGPDLKMFVCLTPVKIILSRLE